METAAEQEKDPVALFFLHTRESLFFSPSSTLDTDGKTRPFYWFPSHFQWIKPLKNAENSITHQYYKRIPELLHISGRNICLI